MTKSCIIIIYFLYKYEIYSQKYILHTSCYPFSFFSTNSCILHIYIFFPCGILGLIGTLFTLHSSIFNFVTKLSIVVVFREGRTITIFIYLKRVSIFNTQKYDDLNVFQKLLMWRSNLT